MMIFGLFGRKKGKCNPDMTDLSAHDWPDYVVTLNEKNFDDFIQKYPVSVVDFWAPWCGPCRAMIPRLRRLSKIYKRKVVFGRLNTQANEEISKRYHIMGIPHLIFFCNGKKISSATGVKSVGSLKESIDTILNK